MKTKQRGVYGIKNKINQKIYVGSAADIPTRTSNHKFHLLRGTHANRHLQSAYNHYGADAFEFVTLEKVPASSDLRAAEQAWMNKLNTCDRNFGYNIATSPAVNGCTLSQEHVKSIRLGLSGKSKSQEHRDKLSAANKGKKHTLETRQRIKDTAGKQNKIKNSDPGFRKKVSDSLKGHAVSDESRKRISAANKGRKMTEGFKENLRVTSPLVRSEIQSKRANGYSQLALSKEYGVSISTIRRITGEMSSTK